MKTNRFTGWREVFAFTFLQAVKSKAYQISLIILVLITLIAMPAISLFTSDQDEFQVNPIQKIYVDNQLGVDLSTLEDIKEAEEFAHITFVPMESDYETTSALIDESENDSIILTMSIKEGIFSLDFVKSSEGPVSKEDLNLLGDSITPLFENAKVELSGATEEQKDIIFSPITTSVTVNDLDGSPIIEEDTSINSVEYFILYGVIIVLMLINIMAGSSVASSIATEKSTRVIEYLLTSIKPLALMVGKVLAMLLATLIQMLSLIIATVIANMISGKISGNGTSLLAGLLPDDIYLNLSPLNIIVSLIIFILGMVFFATLASVAGATVSKMEEITEGLTLITSSNIIGCYISMGATIVLMNSGMNGFVSFAFLFPLSAPFALPGAILIGKASLIYGAIAIVLLLISIYLLFLFVAKIYEALILHKGNTIKTKDLIKMFRSI